MVLLEHYNFTNGYLIFMNLRQILLLARQIKRRGEKKKSSTEHSQANPRAFLSVTLCSCSCVPQYLPMGWRISSLGTAGAAITDKWSILSGETFERDAFPLKSSFKGKYWKEQCRACERRTEELAHWLKYGLWFSLRGINPFIWSSFHCNHRIVTQTGLRYSTLWY